MKRIFLVLLFVVFFGACGIVQAEESVMTDSGEVEETSDGSFLTDSGEVHEVGDDGSYMTDSGEIGEADEDADMSGESASGEGEGD